MINHLKNNLKFMGTNTQWRNHTGEGGIVVVEAPFILFKYTVL